MFFSARWLGGLSLGFVFLVFSLLAPRAGAYSLLTHEQLIDLTWQDSIVPLLRGRYPGLTEGELERAHAYAYGGCAIQDIGYYPFGNKFFSELTHYVRTGDFVASLFRNAHDADELAFAVGALSHYIGDAVGHAEATNRAVPVEFPRLEAAFGPLVTYAEDGRAHVSTEFAFDINEIAHHRLAPLRYTQQVGLRVSTRQLAAAFAETYGLGEKFSGSSRRVNVRGYRFVVRWLIPRAAYSLTVLHRRQMPGDAPTAEFEKMEREFERVATEEDWDRYRRRPGLLTYSLAGLILVTPKIGPLRILAIKGPRPETEELYVRSVNESTDGLREALGRFAGPGEPGRLENRDLDTGATTHAGGYRLTDETYARLLQRLTAKAGTAGRQGMGIPAAVKADVLGYFADPDAPSFLRMDAEKWARVQAELAVLRGMAVQGGGGDGR